MTYDAAQLKAMAAKGETFDGTDSYPIANGADLENAIRAVGRGNSSHDAIRKYVIGRAKALGLSSKIPADWSAEGAVSNTDATGRSAEDVGGTMFRSLATADVELRGSGDGRTLAGILVPYGVQQRIDRTLVEEFVPGAFADQVRAMTPGRLDGGLVPLCMNHEPHGGVRIGKVTALREDAAGLYGEARISNTSAGNDTLALLNDGILREWSIGFRPQQNRANGAVTQRIKSHLTELAIVGSGAYGGAAAVSAIRANTMCPACAALQSESRVEPVEDNHVEPAEAMSNQAQAARLIAQLPLLSLNGPAGAPGGPASVGNSATWSP